MSAPTENLYARVRRCSPPNRKGPDPRVVDASRSATCAEPIRLKSHDGMHGTHEVPPLHEEPEVEYEQEEEPEDLNAETSTEADQEIPPFDLPPREMPLRDPRPLPGHPGATRCSFVTDTVRSTYRAAVLAVLTSTWCMTSVSSTMRTRNSKF